MEAGLTPERGPVILDATDVALVLHKNQSSSRGEGSDYPSLATTQRQSLQDEHGTSDALGIN